MKLNKRNEAKWIPIVLGDMFETDLLGGTTKVSNIGISVPAVNIMETDEKFVVEVAAPGKR